MASSAQLTVPTGAIQTRLSAALDSADTTFGDTLVVTNTGTVTLHIGGPGVSITDGWRLPAGATLGVDVAESLFAVVAGAAAGSCDLLRVR